MPIFREDSGQLSLIAQSSFKLERELQRLIEANLEEVFACRFIASEFSTGAIHGGRIDTLALSEDNNPVIIEYKNVENAELINQALFYLDWIQDHRGDFEVAASKALGNVKVDWGHIRVICVAPNYSKYSMHAVKQIGTALELWQFSRYQDGTLHLEEVFRRESAARVRAPRLAPQSSPAALEERTFETHLAKADAEVQQLALELREFLLDLNESVAEVPQKMYVAYKLTRNFACIEIQRKKLLLFLTLDPSRQSPISRDMTGVGHYGTGDLLVTVSSDADLEFAKHELFAAFQAAGGD